MSGYVRISLLDIFFGYDFKSYPNSQQLSNHNLTYPILSYPILSYPKLSMGANSQMFVEQLALPLWMGCEIQTQLLGLTL